MNIIDFRIEDKIIFKYYKVSIIIKIYREQRFYKIAIDKFFQLSIKSSKAIIENSLLTLYNIILIDILLYDILNKVYIYSYTKKSIQILLI